MFRVRLCPFIGIGVIATTSLPVANGALLGRRTLLLVIDMLIRLTLREETKPCSNRITRGSIRRLERLIRTNTTGRATGLDGAKVLLSFRCETTRFVRNRRFNGLLQQINVLTRTTRLWGTRGLTILPRARLKVRKETAIHNRNCAGSRGRKRRRGCTRSKRRGIGWTFGNVVCQLFVGVRVVRAEVLFLVD